MQSTFSCTFECSDNSQVVPKSVPITFCLSCNFSTPTPLPISRYPALNPHQRICQRQFLYAAFNFSCSTPPKTLPLVCLLSSFIIIMYFSVSGSYPAPTPSRLIPDPAPVRFPDLYGRRALAALYLTLGSLMAGNRILMDFVISSTKTTMEMAKV